MNAEEDRFWMRRALAEAVRGRGAVEPNPMVGAVVVRDGRLVGFGHHARFGGPHAEVEALRAAGELAQGATFYVTLEPCCHTGKTPPCADAIIEAGIKRVVAALPDPFPQVSGGGLARLRAAGLAVETGLEEAQARWINAPYLKRLTTGQPFVLAKWAMTLDGKTACASGDSKWISTPKSRALVHEDRGRMDGILVGIGTALADDPELTARPSGPRAPTRIVLDPAARLPMDSRLARSAADGPPVWLAVTDRAPDDRLATFRGLGVEPLVFSGHQRVPIPALLDELGRRGLTNLMVEGGGHVLGAIFDADAVDAVSVYIAPVIEGGSHAYQPVRGLGVARMTEALRLAGLTVQEVDGDLVLKGHRDRPWLHPAEVA